MVALEVPMTTRFKLGRDGALIHEFAVDAALLPPV